MGILRLIILKLHLYFMNMPYCQFPTSESIRPQIKMWWENITYNVKLFSNYPVSSRLPTQGTIDSVCITDFALGGKRNQQNYWDIVILIIICLY